MNKARRKRLQEALDLLDELKNCMTPILEGARDIVDEVRDDEEMAMDNLPESMAFSAQHDAFEDNISDLEEALACIDDAIATLEDNAEKCSYEDVAQLITDAANALESAIAR